MPTNYHNPNTDCTNEIGCEALSFAHLYTCPMYAPTTKGELGFKPLTLAEAISDHADAVREFAEAMNRSTRLEMNKWFNDVGMTAGERGYAGGVILNGE